MHACTHTYIHPHPPRCLCALPLNKALSFSFFKRLESVNYVVSVSTHLQFIPPLLCHSTKTMFPVVTSVLLIPKFFTFFGPSSYLTSH